MNVSQTGAAQPSIPRRSLTSAVTLTAKDHDGVDWYWHEKNTNILLFGVFRLISTAVYQKKNDK